MFAIACRDFERKKKIIYLLRDFIPKHNLENQKKKVTDQLNVQFEEAKKEISCEQAKNFEQFFDLEFVTFAHYDYAQDTFKKNTDDFRAKIEMDIQRISNYDQSGRISYTGLGKELIDSWNEINSTSSNKLKTKSISDRQICSRARDRAMNILDESLKQLFEDGKGNAVYQRNLATFAQNLKQCKEESKKKYLKDTSDCYSLI